MNAFFQKKNILFSPKVYFIDALGSMAFGLFASLLVGTILNSLGQALSIPFLSETLWPMARDAAGPAMGVAIAYALQAPPLVLFSCAVVGSGANALGGPVAVYIAVLFAAELGKAISKETKIDILATPLVTIFTGAGVAVALGPPLSAFMTGLGKLIMTATTLQPVFMGIFVAVVIGMALTLPISSAALCMMLALGGLAGGAATAGCCAQMVGFAYLSAKDNGIKGVSAIGLGTSMLAIPNIVKNPWLWVPPTLAGAVAGPMATVFFTMENSPLGSGMGSCGFVGQIETLSTMTGLGWPVSTVLFRILIVQFVVPLVVTGIAGEVLKRMGKIKPGDMLLNY